MTSHPRRVLSLVPSLTETVASLGAAERLVGVTRYCLRGAPEGCRVVGGTKNPDLPTILDLRPDLVLANTEENRPADLQSLRAAGIEVLETYPRTVDGAAEVVRVVGDALGAAAAAATICDAIGDALAEAVRRAPPIRVMALTLVWRRPWMALGPDTYADDLLWQCGFGNVLSGAAEQYPRLDEGLQLGADVVLLPSEPYAFGSDDLAAVADLAGDMPAQFVDGELLTWHGPRTPDALRAFSDLAQELSQGARRA